AYNTRARDVAWEVEDGGRHLRYHWGADDALKAKVGLDFDGELWARDDSIEFEIHVRNVGDEQWTREPMQLVCLRSARSPAFEDYEAERTWVRREGEWVSMREVMSAEFADHRMTGIQVGRDPNVERLSAKTSADGEWTLGLAVDRAISLSFNFQQAVSCIHSNPSWGLLKPGEEATARGRMYLLKADLDELHRRYGEDFEG
ncbi:MAG TPA: hypothetical protein QGH10_25165, partial [Armatimonadota bacterium]|nr:hypothetical protein [Armatimonadota bacterium]